RRVEIAGIASRANGVWMTQIGRNVTDAVDGILNGKRYLIHDRDPLFTTEFQKLLASVGVTSVKLPPQSPNLNAYAERFVRSIKESCLERLILFRDASLKKAIQNLASHRAALEMKEAGELPGRVRVRSSQYLNNLVEQD